MQRIYFLGVFLFFLLTFTLPSQALEQYEGKEISGIDIIVKNLPSDNYFEENAIRLRLKSKVGEIFSQLAFDADLKVLAQEYNDVDPILKVENEKIHIALHVSLKPIVASIVWKGNKGIKISKLKKELGIKERSVFDRAVFNRAFYKLKALYVKKGFFEAELNYKADFSEEKNEVEIVIDIKEGRSGHIQGVDFKGLSKEEKAEILEMMLMKKYNLFTSWVTGAGTYHEEAVDQDKLAVTNYLQNLGYANAKVDISVIESKRASGIRLLVSVEKGLRYTFGKISFEGNSLFSDAEIFRQLLIREGESYSLDKVRESVRNITDIYGTQGHIESYVTYEPHLTPSKKQYAIHCVIHEGEQYRVGMIKIFGNTSTHSRVILHESHLVPGDVFNIRKLRATEETLKLIGYFKNVNVYWAKASEKEGLGSKFRDIHIEVEENSTGSFSFAFGVSTLESLFGSVEIMERNFNYKGIPYLFREGPSAMRGDGEYTRARLNVGRRHRNILLSWTKPYFRDTPWIVGFNVEKANNRQQSRDYDIDSLGFTLHASYPINSYLRFEWQYRLRDIKINVSSDAGQSLKNEVDNSGLISASSVALAYDSVDHPYKPKNGFLSRLETEFAGLGGDFTFFSLSYLNTYYVRLHERGVFKYRADLRFIHPLGSTDSSSLPLAERFFLGGETSVRGYRGFSVGPKYNNKNPKGGISSGLLSIEYLHTLTDRMDLFSFIDAGNVSEEKYHIGLMRMSYGFGLRLEIFKNIPIVMGVGYPVNPESRDEVKRFFFSLGGRF